jgi:hypothetical protein
MSKQLNKLIYLLKEIKHPEFKKIAYLADVYKKAQANESGQEKITISLDELQSLVDSDYEFSRTEIGFIGIEKK